MNNRNITPNKPKFSAMIQTAAYQKALKNALSDPREIQKFTAAITSVVSTNPQIEECTADTILSAALCGHSLKLAPSPQLGQYYIVPFKDRKNQRTVATFVLGYKGYLQLAIRSGQYKRLNVSEVKEGEFAYWDPFNGEIRLKPIEDYTARKAAETVGYYAMFEYTNGFRKELYWTKEEMRDHAIKYSSGYANDIKKGYNYTFWSKDFDGMAKKTMLRQLIGKWGVMSVDMQSAYIADGAVLDDNGAPEEYPDNKGDNMIDIDMPQGVDEGTEETAASGEYEEGNPPLPTEVSSLTLDEFM